MDYWHSVQHTPRCTPLAEFPRPGSSEPFQLGASQVWYLGSGWFAGAAPRRFRVEDERRVEYGEAGAYVHRVYHFAVAADAAGHFTGWPSSRDFPGLGRQGPFAICHGVWLGQEFGSVSEQLQAMREQLDGYAEGEARRPLGDVTVFSHQWIQVDGHELLFFNKGKGARLMAFAYALPEGGLPIGLYL